MPILTLTTDWGLRDHYLAAFKGELLSMIPSLQLVDISHDVEKYNTMQAAFIVQNSYKKFPPGTIHFICISGNENCKSKTPFVVIRTNGQYLLGEDNGIFTLILGKDEKEIIRLPVVQHSSRNIIFSSYLENIKKLAEGVDFKLLGIIDNVLVENYFANPVVDNDSIRGSIIYIDSFGNAVLNITPELFEKERRGRSFVVNVKKSAYTVSEISLTYEDADVGEMAILFNLEGLMEIALNKESASKLLGLKIMDTIKIDFNDSPVG